MRKQTQTVTSFGVAEIVGVAASHKARQVRAQDILPSHLANIAITVSRENEALLEQGALIVISEARVRILPLQKRS